VSTFSQIDNKTYKIYNMTMKIKVHLSKVLMNKLGIKTVFLFGSQAQKLSGPLSDYDFGVLLKNSSILKTRSLRNRIYSKLYDTISSQINKLVNIDIVFLDEMPLQLKYHVIKDGVILYTDKQSSVFDFKEKVMMEHCDFAPLRKEFHDAILNRI
jgi:hypothetical protein